MKILLTGASGFLGGIISKHFILETVYTLGRNSTNDIQSNMAVEVPKLPPVEMVIHCAGKAHLVPKTLEEKLSFFEVNVVGTKNLLHALESLNPIPKSFVLISTVAVYGKEAGEMITEKCELLAMDSYGLSKVQAEQIVTDWCALNGVICSILRLPLIVGPNPPGNLGSMIKGINGGYYFNIGGGKAKKSMVLAEDVAKIVPTVAKIGGVYNLTDGYNPSFAELSLCISSQLNKKRVRNIPLWFARITAKMGDFIGRRAPINSSKLSKITSNLTFDDSLAREKLGWDPKPVLNGLKYL